MQKNKLFCVLTLAMALAIVLLIAFICLVKDIVGKRDSQIRECQKEQIPERLANALSSDMEIVKVLHSSSSLDDEEFFIVLSCKNVYKTTQVVAESLALTEVGIDQKGRQDTIINRFESAGVLEKGSCGLTSIWIGDRSDGSTAMIVYQDRGVIIINDSTE